MKGGGCDRLRNQPPHRGVELVMRFLKNLNLATIIAAASAAMVVLALAIVSGVVYFLLSAHVQEQAVLRQDASLRILATIAARDIPGTKVTWAEDGNVSRVVMETPPSAFDDHTMIDSVGRMTGETATVFAWDPQTRDFYRKTTNLIKSDGSRAVGTQLGQNGAVYPVVTTGKTYRGEAVILGTPYYTIYEPIFSQAGDIIGILYAGVRKSAVNAVLSSIGGELLAVFGVIVLVSVGAMTLLIRGLTKPIHTLAGAAHRIAADDFQTEVPFLGRSNEVGRLADAVESFRRAAMEKVELAAAQAGDQEAKQRRQHAIDEMIAGFRSTVASLIQETEATNRALDETATALARVAAQSTERTESAAGASSEASNNVQSVASAAEELSASIGEISRQVAQTTDVVGRATVGTQHSNEKVIGLAAAASKIGEVVTLIQAIAEQTNLLALNATIEAARAGEAGRGFAVVAAEVKELANQTSKATEEISAQIGAIQGSTSETASAIGAIAKTMEEVNGYTSAIAAAVEQQGAATGEISRNIQQAARGTRTVVEDIGMLTRSVNDTTASAESVTTASKRVSATSERLRAEVEAFLGRVAAA